MNRNKRTHTMAMAALLIAVGVVIPAVMPIKVVIPPASFTLASHVATMLAMFVSPFVAVIVAVGTTLGFLLGGFPIAVVLRALSHVVWAGVGAFYLKAYPDVFTKRSQSVLFLLGISFLHAVCEVVIILPLYFGNALSEANYTQGFFYSIFLLVGVGTLIHSIVDFLLSLVVWKVLAKSRSVQMIAQVKEISFFH